VTFSVVVIETGPSSFIESIGVRSPGFLETKIGELSWLYNGGCSIQPKGAAFAMEDEGPEKPTRGDEWEPIKILW
jgi:hypothetical protein